MSLLHSSLHPFPDVCGLADVEMGKSFEIVDVVSPADAPDWARRLQEIGFIVGERVRVLRRAMPGGDPLAIRVSDSTFALRRAEAACVMVKPVQEHAE